MDLKSLVCSVDGKRLTEKCNSSWNSAVFSWRDALSILVLRVQVIFGLILQLVSVNVCMTNAVSNAMQGEACHACVCVRERERRRD